MTLAAAQRCGSSVRDVLVRAAVAAVLLAACAPAIDWDAVERDITAEWPGVVLDVEHDPVDDFVIVELANGTESETAVTILCGTVLPVLDEAGSIALFAAYSEEGSIIASWNRCDLD